MAFAASARPAQSAGRAGAGLAEVLAFCWAECARADGRRHRATPDRRGGDVLPSVSCCSSRLALAATLLLCRYAVAYGRRLAFRERYMRGFPVEPRQATDARARDRRTGGPLVALLGVAVAPTAVLPVPDGPVAVPSDPSPTTPVATAREARPAAGDTRFVPSDHPPGGVYTAVVPVATVGNEPGWSREDPTKVGWWDGIPTSAIRTGRL